MSSNTLPVFRDILGRRQKVGEIALLERVFSYCLSYVATEAATPLSFSLPLQEEAFKESEFRPYFEGLLPEGPALRALAENLGVREEDYLGILSLCGADCIGDIVIGDGNESCIPTYEPLSADALRELLSQPKEIASSSAVSRLSLAGTQAKVGLYHDDESLMEEGWSRPLGGAPSTHILKAEAYRHLAIIEYLSIACARACGITVPNTWLLDYGSPILCSQRFDRLPARIEGSSQIMRLHQEDMTQALGILPGSKYAELEPSTAAAVTEFLRQHSARPLEDIKTFVSLTCFNFAIGNCDNHLKNLSILYSNDGRYISLAPSYDIVSTTYYERFSRDLAMCIGRASSIDDVEPQDFALFSREVGLSFLPTQRACRMIVERLIPALREAAKELALRFDGALIIADDMEEEITPRLELLKEVLKTV